MLKCLQRPICLAACACAHLESATVLDCAVRYLESVAAMDPAVVQALVQQAAQAEARLAQIESKITAGGGLSSSSVADLQQLRALLLDAKAENEQLKAERDQAVKAAKVAEAEASKAQYRILHLVRSLRQADAQAAPASS